MNNDNKNINDENSNSNNPIHDLDDRLHFLAKNLKYLSESEVNSINRLTNMYKSTWAKEITFSKEITSEIDNTKYDYLLKKINLYLSKVNLEKAISIPFTENSNSLKIKGPINITVSNEISKIMHSNISEAWWHDFSTKYKDTISTAIKVTLDNDLIDSLGKISELYDNSLYGTVKTKESTLLKTTLEEFYENTEPGSTIEDFLVDIVEEKDETKNEEVLQTTPEIKSYIILRIVISLILILFTNPYPLSMASGQPISEIGSRIKEVLEQIYDLLKSIQISVSTSSTDLNTLLRAESLESLMIKTIIERFMNGFLILALSKIKSSNLSIKNIQDIDALIDAVISEISSEKKDKDFIKELLKANLLLIKLDGTKIMSSINGKTTAVLNKNQFVIRDSKSKKWVAIYYLVEDELLHGWVLSKRLKKFENL